jgi:hypothetical protein
VADFHRGGKVLRSISWLFCSDPGVLFAAALRARAAN